MHIPDPQSEHHWLAKFVGEWETESECSPGPDQPPLKTSGSESVRKLGEFWVICEGEGSIPGGTIHRSIITLGYDPAKKKFVGSFVGSAMNMMWVYEGSLDPSGKKITMDTTGPSMMAEGAMAQYQDIFEIVSDDHRILSSRILGPDGKWTDFMTMHYRRKR